jgi:hypothetical protein
MFVNLLRIGQLSAVVGKLTNIAGSNSFSSLNLVRLFDCFGVGHALCHKTMLGQQVVNKESRFIPLSFMVNPQLIFGDERKTVMLSEIRELLIDMAADIGSIDLPDGKIAMFFNLV